RGLRLWRLITQRSGHAQCGELARAGLLADLLAPHGRLRIEALARLLADGEVDVGRHAGANAPDADRGFEQLDDSVRVAALERLPIVVLRARHRGRRIAVWRR